jgi:hypothetical protein
LTRENSRNAIIISDKGDGCFAIPPFGALKLVMIQKRELDEHFPRELVVYTFTIESNKHFINWKRKDLLKKKE